MRFLFSIAGLTALLFISSIMSCKRPAEKVLVKLGGETQGTYYAITYFTSDTINLQQSVDSLLHRFDSTASTYKPNSIISRINANDSLVVVDSMFRVIFEKAMQVSEASNGAFDITVGPLVSAWGFGLSNRLQMNQSRVDSILPLIGYKKVKLIGNKILKTNPNISLDFNAIAQGYSVDVLGAFLLSRGITDFLVDIGGEVIARGSKPDGTPWNVAVELPSKSADDDRKIQVVLRLQNKAISTSGNYRKFYEENGIRYSHTIDPSTGYPVKHSLLSVSVLADDCITADAYATVLMVLGLDKGKLFLQSHPELEAYFIFSGSDGSMKTYYTKGFGDLLQ
jgi:thiamine biosynthesis lipoprotein